MDIDELCNIESSEFTFECQYCLEKFSVQSFCLATYLYGAIFLNGSEYGYLGTSCPNCTSTTLNKMDLSTLAAWFAHLDRPLTEIEKRFMHLGPLSGAMNTMALSLHNILAKLSPGPLQYYSRYSLSTLFGPVSSNYPMGGARPFVARAFPLSVQLNKSDLEISVDKIPKNHPEEVLSPYIPGSVTDGIMCTIPMFMDEEIQTLLNRENKDKIPIFPRYHFASDFRRLCDDVVFLLALSIGFKTNGVSIGASIDSDSFLKISASHPTRLAVARDLNFLEMLGQGCAELLRFPPDVLDFIMKSHFPFKGLGLKQAFQILSRWEDAPDVKNVYPEKIDEIWSEYDRILTAKPDFLFFIAREFLFDHVKIIAKLGVSDFVLLKLVRAYIDKVSSDLRRENEKAVIVKNLPKSLAREVRVADESLGGKILSRDLQITRTKVQMVNYLKGSKNNNILILGEPGTGKELFAEACHKIIGENRPFVIVNCSAIDESLFVSQLFGYEMGAHSTAFVSSDGYAKEAEGGCLFLDEIGDLSLGNQARILRFIQFREIQPIGRKPERIDDLTIIMGTNRKLDERVRNGQFRADLLHRMSNSFPINIPPLRERRCDIPLLLEHFVQQSCKKRTVSEEVFSLSFSEEALEYAAKLDYPGNARDLENIAGKIVMERTVRKDNSQIARSEIERLYCDKYSDSNASPTDNRTRGKVSDERLLSALKNHNGNRTRASEEVGLSYRQVARRLDQMKAKGIDVPSSESSD